MRQKLFTKEIDNKLFSQYKLGNDLKNQMVVAKIFNPYGNGTFYLLNSDPSDPDYIWAIVNLFEIEVGSVSRESLEMMKVPPFGLNLERDIYFQPINASELLSRLNQGETFAKGGKVHGYKIYHDTLAQALEEVEDFFHNEGYLFTSDNYFPDVTVGGIGYGETARITRPIQLQGKSKEGVANIQIYRMDSGRYELNMYPSYANGGVLRNDYYKIKEVDKEGNTYYTYLVKNIASPTPPNAIEISKEEYDMANKFADGGEIKDRIEEVKKDAKDSSKRNKTKTYVFDYEFNKDSGRKVASLSERITWGQEEDLEYFKEKGWEKYFKVIATYENGEEKFADGGELQIIKNDSGENYLANADSTPNEMAVKLANGGFPNAGIIKVEDIDYDMMDYLNRTNKNLLVTMKNGSKIKSSVGKSYDDLVFHGDFPKEIQGSNYRIQKKSFDKIEIISDKMAKGGSIPNNYRGRTTEDIWNSLSEDQRIHFMIDHFNELGVKESEIVGIANQEFQDLNEDVQGAFKVHTMMGQYADGGETNLSRDRMFKSQQSWEQDYKRKTRPKNPHYKKFADGGMTNRDLNLYAQKRANELGVTRKDLGYDYSIALAQALVEGLTDANSHSEVRQFISILEKRPEWAKDPYADKSSVPEFGSPQYSEWRDNSVYSSKYYDADDNVRELGIDVSQKSGYDGYGIAMAFKYVAQMNGEQKLASNIDKVFGGKMAKGGMTDFPSISERKNKTYYHIIWDDGNKVNDLVFDSKSEAEEKYDSLEKQNGIKAIHLSKETFSKYGHLEKHDTYKMFPKFGKGGGIYEGGYSSMKELNQDYKRIITNKERNEFETSENTYVGKTVTIKLPNMADSFRMKVKNEYATMVSGGGKNGGVYDKKYIISKGEGGTTTFNDKVKSISQSLLKRKKVSPSVQKDYGKTYDKKEAVDSAKRIAGAMRSKYMGKKKS